MDFFTEPSLKLSFFNSIFELLAGFNFAYAGLQILRKLIDSYLLKQLEIHQDEAQNAVLETSLLAESLNVGKNTAENESSILLSPLVEVANRYKRYFTEPELLHKKATLKFIPGFVFCGFYCFFILILSAFSESDKVISFNGSIIHLGFSGSYSIQSYTFIILAIYNLACSAFIIYLCVRPWETRVAETAEFNDIKINFYRATQFFVGSVLISAVLCWWIHYIPTDSLFNDLLLIFWSLVISVSPILSFLIWVFAVHNVKFAVQNEVIREVRLYLQYKYPTRPKVLANLPEDTKNFKRIGNSKYLGAENKERALKWLRVKKFRQLYGWKIAGLSIFSLVFLGYINMILGKQDSPSVDLIKKAVNREFEAYKKLPDIDTAWYDDFFAKNSEIRQKITERLEYHKNNSEIITNPGNPSGYDFVDGKEVYINTEKLVVQTSEYWDMKWYNAKTCKYSFHYSHTVTIPQLYIFKKEDDEWMIDKNSNMGTIQYLE